MRKLIPREVFVDPVPDDLVYRMMNFRPYVRQSGDDLRPVWHLGERKLLDYLLVYFDSGYGRFSVDGKEFKYSKGYWFWVPPDTPHEMWGEAEESRCMYVHFDLIYDPGRSHWDASIPVGFFNLDGYRELLHPPIDDPVIGSWSGKLTMNNSAFARSILSQICLEHKRSANAVMPLLSGLMLQLIHELDRGNSEDGEFKNSQYRVMQEAFSYIMSHLDEDLDVEHMARRFGFSASHFRKLFREIHGQSPRRVHRIARIRSSCELMIYGSQNISEVAAKLGFSNVHNFSRAFKEVTSMSPREYLNRGR
jgi:AraC-like DNA-binding protein